MDHQRKGVTVSDKTVIKIEFDNPAAAEHFATWLCESGEQTYWQWMECREDDEDEGDITALSFDYHNTKVVNGEDKYEEFMADLTIRTECGRMDDGER